ncbi:MAG: hopanoid-associated sugar epimerase [Alphaproteobacteria bacterium]
MEELKPNLTLVTGATGFVGSAVARILLAEGCRLRVLTRPNSDRSNLQGLDVEYAHGDLTDAASLDAAAQGCDALFHVAADYRIWVPDPEAMHRANVEGTRNLMEAAQRSGVRRIVYTSSVATLGLDKNGSADEATPSSMATMVGTYKKSKYMAEAEVRKLIESRQLPCVIVNPSTPIGPRDIKPTPTGRLIVEAASGKIPAYVDTGLNVVHVDDVAMGHWLAFRRGKAGERYILGGDNMHLSEILAVVAEKTGRKPPKIKLPVNAIWPIAVAAEAAGYVTRREPFVTMDALRMARKKMFFTSAKAERELGYRHRPAPQAIADAVAWFKQQGYC